MTEAIFAALGLSVAAFAIWLTVRIINRRERWAKRTAIAITLVLVVYPLSWGPAIYIYQLNDRPAWMDVPLVIYTPLVMVLNSTQSSRPWFIEPYRRYVFWFMIKGK